MCVYTVPCSGRYEATPAIDHVDDVPPLAPFYDILHDENVIYMHAVKERYIREGLEAQGRSRDCVSDRKGKGKCRCKSDPSPIQLE